MCQIATYDAPQEILNIYVPTRTDDRYKAPRKKEKTRGKMMC